MAASLSRLNDLVTSYGGKFVYIGVPEQYSMFRDLYPSFLNNNDELLSLTESSFFSELETYGIDYIDMRREFLQYGDYAGFYSKTDHHYNLFGAFYVYGVLTDKINGVLDAPLPVLTADDIDFVKLDNPFYGSRSRKLYNAYKTDDKLWYYTQKNPLPYVRTNNYDWAPTDIFALPVDDTSPVTYNLYMGGDIAETIIQTNRPELPDALIFGDSFTNPLETFLYQSFNETRSLDMRYYTDCTLLEYVQKYKPDYVFCERDDTAYLSFDGNGNIGVPVAVPVAQDVYVNGAETAFGAYNINGSVYFKLDDLAYALNGTRAQFSPVFDETGGAVTLTAGEPHLGAGYAPENKTESVIPVPSASRVYVGEVKPENEMSVISYDIGGDKYFRLRDIGAALDFGVSWDAEKNAVIIDTDERYKP